MWLIVGHKGSLEAVKDAPAQSIECSHCNRMRKHNPFKYVQSATAFFMPIANFRVEHVYVCVSCGQRVARDSSAKDTWTIDQQGTAAGQLMNALDKGSEAVQRGIERGSQEAASRGIDQAAAVATVQSAFAWGSDAWTEAFKDKEPPPKATKSAKPDFTDVEELPPKKRNL